jgi:hypothetical protein
MQGDNSQKHCKYSPLGVDSQILYPQNEGFLLMIAQHGTASHPEQVVAVSELEEEKEEDVSAETLLAVDVLQQRGVATHDQIMDLYQLT